MQVVFVSAGHDSRDSGAISESLNLKEADLTLELRDMIVSSLIGKHIPVKADGSRGENKPLRDAIKLANLVDGPRIEVHFNAGPSSAKGVEVLALPEHRVLAQKIASAIAGVTGTPLRGDGGYKPQDSGQHHRLAFCMDGKGLVVEVEFISNDTALRNYLINKVSVADAIATVLAGFINES